MHKYLLKTFYNRINNKEYDLQIWKYNIYHINIITIKDLIVAAERNGKNKELLTKKNVDKTIIAEIAKVLSAINFENKHS